MKPLLVLAGIAAVVAALYFATLGQAGVQCEACVAFGGVERCQSARAATEDEARRSAVATACAPLTRGVTETLDCERKAPQSLRCEVVGGG